MAGAHDASKVSCQLRYIWWWCGNVVVLKGRDLLKTDSGGFESLMVRLIGMPISPTSMQTSCDIAITNIITSFSQSHFGADMPQLVYDITHYLKHMGTQRGSVRALAAVKSCTFRLDTSNQVCPEKQSISIMVDTYEVEYTSVLSQIDPMNRSRNRNVKIGIVIPSSANTTVWPMIHVSLFSCKDLYRPIMSQVHGIPLRRSSRFPTHNLTPPIMRQETDKAWIIIGGITTSRQKDTYEMRPLLNGTNPETPEPSPNIIST